MNECGCGCGKLVRGRFARGHNRRGVLSERFIEVKPGDRFGRLVALEERPREPFRAKMRVQCDCGTEKRVSSYVLVRGVTLSCGCLRREVTMNVHRTHGHAPNGQRTSTYSVWVGMRNRCNNPNQHNHERYGGRGITVCERWDGPDGFASFLADMGERPEGRTLDRVDNDGPYSPDNCRWATTAEQVANKRPRKDARVVAS